MMQGARAEPEHATALCHCLDYIWSFFVFSKAVDNDNGTIGEDGLNPEFTSDRMDVISQSAEIHVRALLDTRNRALRHIQKLGHIRLRELFGASQFFERHAL